MSLRTLIFASAALLLAAAGDASAASGAGAKLGRGDIALGLNAEKQACRAVTRFDATGGATAYDIFCGEWERPSGRATLYPAGARAKADAAGGEVCKGAGKTLPAEGFDSLTQTACASEGAAVARYALVARRAGQTVVASGFPADWSALVAAARVLTGLQKGVEIADARASTAGLREIEAVYPAGPPGQSAAVNYELLRRRAAEYNLVWRFGTAERDFQELLRAHQATAPQDLAGEAEILAEIGLNLSSARRFSEAGEAFDQAERKAAQGGASLLQLKLLNYRAIDKLNQRRFREAMGLADRALQGGSADGPKGGGVQITAAASSDIESRAAAQSHRSLLMSLGEATPEERKAVLSAQSAYIGGVAAEQLGRADADARLSEAQRRLQTARNPPGWLAAQIADRRARLRLSQKDTSGAMASLNTGLQLIRTTAPGTRGEAHLLLTKAQIERAMGDRAAGMTDAKAAIALFSSQVEEPGMPADVAAPYLGAVLDAWTRAPSTALANDYFEGLALVWNGSAARSAAQLAARLATKEGGAQARAYQDAERGYRGALARRKRLSADPNAPSAQLTAAEAALVSAQKGLDTAEAALRSTSPRYLELLSPKASATDLAELLGPEEGYLRIVLGSTESYGALVTRKGVQPYRVPLTEAQARTLVGKIQRTAPLSNRGALRTFDLKAASELHAGLIGPVRAGVEGLSLLQVDVSGPLLEAPFAALVEGPVSPAVVEKVKNQDYTGVPWLGRRLAIANALGPASFVRLRKANRAALDHPLRAAVFGGFVPDPTEVAAALAQANKLSEQCRARVERGLARLPALDETNDEAKAVAATFGTGARVRLGRDFSDVDFLHSPEVETADVIHLATHGVLALDSCFAEPALLTSYAKGGSGLIQASALLDRKLTARLVVLSACDTAKGSGSDVARTGVADTTGEAGEALSGLARGFIYAGAASVLATEWKVDSKTSATVVTSLLRDATAGGTVGEALRRVQIKLMAEVDTSHPFYWAPFLLVGDGGATLGKGAPAPVQAASAAPR